MGLGLHVESVHLDDPIAAPQSGPLRNRSLLDVADELTRTTVVGATRAQREPVADATRRRRTAAALVAGARTLRTWQLEVTDSETVWTRLDDIRRQSGHRIARLDIAFSRCSTIDGDISKQQIRLADTV